MVQRQVFLKSGGWHFSYLIVQGLSFLHLEIPSHFANMCYAFEEKNFFGHHCMKTYHSKLSKTEPGNIP